MALITQETARSAAAKSAEARKRYAAQRKEWTKLQAELPPLSVQHQPAEQPAKPQVDPYVNDSTCAQVEYLAKLRKCDNAKDAAALSQTLKNLRETYHMATGLAKPGVRKPERQSSRAPSNQQAGPELPGDTTTGSVPT